MVAQANISQGYLRLRAENETRTRDPNLGKVVLYQLSYFRLNLLSEVVFSQTRCKGTNFFQTSKPLAHIFSKKNSDQTFTWYI